MPIDDVMRFLGTWCGRGVTVLLLVGSCLGAVPGVVQAATSPAAVSASVASATTLVDNCDDPSAYRLGTITPGARALTTTGANVCSFSWSTNDPAGAMLRVAQADGAGNAMTRVRTNVAATGSDNGNTMHELAAFDTQKIAGITGGGFRRSTDGGVSWYETAVPLAWGNTIAVDPSDATGATWYLAGGNRSIVKTTTGLASPPTWIDLAPALAAAGWPADEDILSISVHLNASAVPTVFLSGESGWIARSTNGGSTFVAYDVPAFGWIHGIAGVPGTDTAYAVMGSGVVGKTTTNGPNAGSWSAAALPTGATSVCAADATHVYVAGSGGVVSNDGSATWTVRKWDIRLTDVSCTPASPSVAYAVGYQGETFRTSNGGATWTRLDSGTAVGLETVVAPSASLAVAAGSSITTVRTADSGSTWTQTAIDVGWIDYTAVAAAPANGQLMVKVGDGGKIRRSTDGGATWADATNADADPLRDVALVDSIYGWAVGHGGTVLRTTDGGQTWTSQRSVPSQVLTAVAAVDRYRAYVVGADGVALRTTDGGSTWSAISVAGVTEDLSAVAVPDDDIVVVAGGGGFYRSTDAGNSFVAAATPGPRQILDVAVASHDVLYAAMGWSAIWKSVDGGATWTALPGVPPVNLVSVDAAGADVAWFGTWDHSELLQTTDGGATFTTRQTSSFGWMSGIVVTEANTAYAVGSRGARYRPLPDPAPQAQVSQYGGGNTWSSGGATNMFAICLQAVDTGTTAVNTPTWQRDTSGASGQCESEDTDPWFAVPAAPSKVATAVANGRADFVFGFRAGSSTRAGTYAATVVFEVVAPAV